jgi:dTDP-4-amino-4,6-dideoxygalactose transaminase
MAFKVPLFDLNFGPDELAAVEQTIRSKWISMGPKTQEFETKFAQMLGTHTAVGVANGTAALHLALRVLGIGEGDEVIVPSLTFVATVNCVRYVNATPVFCDIRSTDDLTVDPAHIEALITPKTKAILVMHYGGFACDMDRIMSIAKAHDLYVVEDAAHAPLSTWKGRTLGTIGDVGCFSFFSNKNISTGEGGMVVARDEEHCRQIKILRSHGMTTLSYERSKGHATSYDVIDLGYNYRIDDIRSTLGLVQLAKLEEAHGKRAQVRRWYLEELDGLPGVIVPFKQQEQLVSNYIFPIVLGPPEQGRRDKVREKLMEAGIQTSVHYPAVHRFSIYQEYSSSLPNTEYVADNLITLPMYGGLQKEQVVEIATRLRESLDADNDSN